MSTITAVYQEGKRNKKFDYKMNGVKIESVQYAKDLVTTASNFKFSRKCKDTVGKANRMPDFIKRNFPFKIKDIILPLYISLARPHLEYVVEQN